MATAVGRPWQRFDAGETAVADIVFRPRLGGGTYRLVVVVKDRDGHHVLWSDHTGLLMYVPPRVGASGVADLEATIAIDGRDLTDHGDWLMRRPPLSR